MGATFSRSRTFVAGEVLTAVNLNGIETNILNNFTFAGMDDYSASLAEMRTTTDPYPASVESQPTSAQGELERIRYQDVLITGETYWYQDPKLSLKHFVTVAATGTNTYAATLDPAITAYTAGIPYFVTFTNAMTALGPTINLNSLGAKTIVDQEGNALLAKDILAGHRGIMVYDGTDMRLLNVRTPRSGTWTPTATLVANLDTCVPVQGHWFRVGNVISAFVEFSADATTSGVTSRLRFSLPVASDFANSGDAVGLLDTANALNDHGVVLADVANNEVELNWIATTTSNITFRASFGYVVF
ncbi:MAG: hypothetical protein Q8P28_04265 [Deltaproteobacteria bacterium]|nr:hypothetical protein [Deltaproteobacteria bacterium]